MGIGSASIMMNEILKLIHYCKLENVEIIRMGSSGGLGVKPGTLIVTEKAFDPLLENAYTLIQCGKQIKLKAEADSELSQSLIDTGLRLGLKIEKGNTISTDDYYEAQARWDGAFCDFSEQEKMDYLTRAHDEFGVRNFEMEATMLLAF